MADTRDIFDRLAEAKLQDFTDPELVELHMKAANHLEEAVVQEYDGRGDQSEYEARLAEKRLESFRSTRDWKGSLYDRS
ncbi:MAG: hypothetical protein ABEJ75_04500 [Candidatus Nanohaloarchaea archaeon]